jgi:hypothetical protein
MKGFRTNHYMVIIIFGIQFQVVYKSSWSHHVTNVLSQFSNDAKSISVLSNSWWDIVYFTMWWLHNVFDYLNIGQMSINYIVN